MPLAHETGLSRQIIGLAMRVHSNLGPGLLENIYERCLCFELERNRIPFGRQADMKLNYEGMMIDCGYRIDIIVADEIVLEVKAVERILPVHAAQLQTCLRLSGCRIGLLLNFNTVSLRDGILRRVL